MNKRYQEKVDPIELKFKRIYPPLNVDVAQRFCRLITLMSANEMKNDAQILKNLRYARSNYLCVFAHNSNKKNGKPIKISAYTNSFKKAKRAAFNLYHTLLKDPHYPLLCKPHAIVDYLQNECKSVGIAP